MIAETRLGHGDQAHDYYQRINPSAREEISELHRCEPYVYAQMIAARTRPPSARPRILAHRHGSVELLRHRAVDSGCAHHVQRP